MKDDKLKSKDFFDVKQDPLITFKSTRATTRRRATYDTRSDKN
jgi:polyisoprenoid-binding protein YceI